MMNIYDLWFSNLDLENHVKLDLLNKCKIEEIWNFGKNDFCKNEIPENISEIILKSKNLEREKYIYEYMTKKNIDLISIKDEKYPNKLRNIENNPAYLYIRGNKDILDDDSIRNSGLSYGYKRRKINS